MKNFQPKVFFIIISIFIIRLALAGTAHADVALVSVPVNTTLNPSVTYIVDGNPIVPYGITLTIPGGTHLVFTAQSRLTVYGTLNAKGTDSKHIVIKSGEASPYIPLAMPLKAVQIKTEDTPPEPQGQSPEVQSPEVAPLTIEETVMHSDAVASITHDGIELYSGSNASFAYVDLSDARYGLRIDSGTTVAIDHVTFTDCDTAIMGITGGMKMTNSSFANDSLPAEILFPFAFSHSNTTFSNNDINGWKISTSLSSGDNVKLDSTDGEYYLPEMTVPYGASITISPGVTVLRKDGEAVHIGGKLNASGTADKPITIYGDGACDSHSPVFSFESATAAVIGHVNFKNICNGIAASHSTVTLTNDSFDTVAGTAVSGIDLTTVSASAITMHNVYQAFDLGNLSHLNLSNADIDTVNGAVPAIRVYNQTPFSAKAVSIDGASTCIAVMKNSSINASSLTLVHCSAAGIASDNDNAQAPSGITLTDSDISRSGTAMKLNFALVTKVSNNHFHDNTVGVSLSNMPKTTIISNGWGSNKGPRIADNPEGDGDSIVTRSAPEVVYRPWLGMDDTVPTESSDRNPIIIVPGITGSFLTKNYDDKSELWPNVTKLALSLTDSFLQELSLLPSGTPDPAKPVTVGDIVRSVSSADIFSSMIASFERNGYKEGTDLFVLPYDWRLSNTANQTLLRAAVANALAKSGKSKVNIVAHSMGGLLVKDYLAHNAAAPIDHLFYIAVPHLGAPKAFQTLMYGDDMGFKFSIGPLQVPLLNADTVKSISQNMPSVYELLPSEKYISKFGSYVRDNSQANRELSLAATEKIMTDDGRNAGMFPLAETLHSEADPVDGSKYSSYDFVGCGSTKAVNSYTLTKEQSFGLTGLKVIPAHRIYYANGDGVVPVKSAAAGNGATNYYVASGSHGTLPSLMQVQNAIVDIINGNPVDTDSGVSTDEKSCNTVAGSTVDVHSPVTLDIYDEQGNHTGPTADGTVEYGIPNVQYDVIGDEKFAFLPAGQDYKIVNHGQGVGTYDMYVTDTTGDDTVTRRLYYNQIPVSSTSTVGTTIVGPGNPSMELYVDEDGSNSDLKKILPTDLEGALALNDVTPPVTTVVIAGNAVMFFPHDNESGVFNTKYSTDGITWNNYTDPFSVTPGTTVQFLSLDEAGNTEDIRHVTIPAVPIAPADTATSSTPPDNNYYYNNTTITQPTVTPVADVADAKEPARETAKEEDASPQESIPEPIEKTSHTETTQVAAIDIGRDSDTFKAPTDLARPEDPTGTADTGTGVVRPEQLLASAGIPATTSDSGVIAGSIAIICLLIGIFIARRFYGKKKNAPIE